MSAKKQNKTEERRLADYKPPVFLIEDVDIDFDIRGKKVRVRSALQVLRNPESKEKDKGLELDGDNQKLLGVWVNGKKLTARSFTLSDKKLIIPALPDEAEVVIESENEPDKNTALLGLYRAGDLLVTQCESEGFRRITYFPDRPDVSSSYRVTIHADKERYPTLLSNGNRVAAGDEDGGRHFVVWEDPFKKPCYLFALVAGQMDKAKTSFVRKSGRKVAIEVYTDPGRKKETGFALKAIPDAMRWDEKTYGLEYDLDLFMLVAVSAFNYGAMENKGLNVFNDACALGSPETATDTDIAYIERVVGHEYFHNYTGDRVTCKNWFQLTLKEGLTVFREQEFCADSNSRPLERVTMVSQLRTRQFAEDAGAMAHAPRPSTYAAIENLVDMTVYRKGSEIFRMMQTMVGEKGFRKGLRAYLKKHDGTGATCEDFVAAMSEANGIDLSPYMLWFEQAGTPVLKIRTSYNAKEEEYTLKISQSCAPTPGQKTKKPVPMPIAIGLLDHTGKDMVDTLVLDLREASETFIIKGVREKPVPSILRGFSAPVRLDYPTTDDELLFLIAHDSDSFNRWDSAQKLFMKAILAGKKPARGLIDALCAALKDRSLDPGFKAAMLALPTDDEIGLALKAAGKTIDPEAIFHAKERVIRAMAEGAEKDLRSCFAKIDASLDVRAVDGKARGLRALKNACLAILSRLKKPEDIMTAHRYAVKSTNMTDKIAGLAILVEQEGALKAGALKAFEKAYGDKPTMMDDWLALQSGARRKGVTDDVMALLKHPAFTFENPNRVRGLFGAYLANPYGFLAEDGSGMLLMTALLPEIDAINPMVSTRLLGAFMRWKDYEPKRRKMMKACLEKMGKTKGFSFNAREMIDKALKM